MIGISARALVDGAGESRSAKIRQTTGCRAPHGVEERVARAEIVWQFQLKPPLPLVVVPMARRPDRSTRDVSPLPTMVGEGTTITMARRRHTPKQIIRNVREADRMLGEGKELAEVVVAWRSPSRPTAAGATSSVA
jgi:hypothetical protein